MKPQFIFSREFSLGSLTTFNQKMSENRMCQSERPNIIAKVSTENSKDYFVGAYEPYTFDVDSFKHKGIRYIEFNKLRNGERILLEDICNSGCYRYITESLSFFNRLATSASPIGVVFPTELTEKSLRRNKVVADYLAERMEPILKDFPGIHILVKNTHFIYDNEKSSYLCASTAEDVAGIVNWLRNRIYTERIGYCFSLPDYYATESFSDLLEDEAGIYRLVEDDPFSFIVRNYKIIDLIVAGKNSGNGQNIVSRELPFSEDEDTNDIKLLADCYKQFNKNIPIVVCGVSMSSAAKGASLLQAEFDKFEQF